jgi:hypothetical protein
MYKRNIAIFVFLLICAIAVLLSQNFWAEGPYTYDFFDWTSYEVTPGDWRYVSFQDSIIGQLIPVIGYIPVIVAGLLFLGAFLVFGSARGTKIAIIIAVIVMAVGIVLYLLPSIFLQIIGSYVPIFNEAGAFIYLVPSVAAVIAAFLLKGPPAMGYVKAEKEYSAMGKTPPVSLPSMSPQMHCPHCNALVSVDQAFCDQCGEYF